MITDDFRERLLSWQHSGFSVHHDVKVRARDVEGQQQLARYMIRAPFALEKMEYKPDSGMIVYRSKMHQSLKRNYQVMPGAQWRASGRCTEPFQAARSAALNLVRLRFLRRSPAVNAAHVSLSRSVRRVARGPGRLRGCPGTRRGGLAQEKCAARNSGRCLLVRHPVLGRQPDLAGNRSAC